MQRILEEIRNGSFAREWLGECRAGRRNFDAMRQADRTHPIERAGRTRRAARRGITRSSGSAPSCGR
jgi:ketol-acid reductoisomerase